MSISRSCSSTTMGTILRGDQGTASWRRSPAAATDTGCEPERGARRDLDVSHHAAAGHDKSPAQHVIMVLADSISDERPISPSAMPCPGLWDIADGRRGSVAAAAHKPMIRKQT